MSGRQGHLLVSPPGFSLPDAALLAFQFTARVVLNPQFHSMSYDNIACYWFDLTTRILSRRAYGNPWHRLTTKSPIARGFPYQ
jgi:hypothetical protein